MALRIATLLLTAASVLVSFRNTTAEILGRTTAQASYLGFTFAPGDCAGQTVDCTLRTPKEWTTGDINIVRKAIDEIVDKPTGHDIVTRTQARGVRVLRRYSVGLSNSAPVPAISAAFRPYRNEIELNDRFFAMSSHRDRFSGKPGYLLAAQSLLHECLHAVDEWSATSEFATLAGFGRTGARWRFEVKTPDEGTAPVRFDKDLACFEKSGDWQAQWRINRTLALGMRPVRVPTLQSIRSPAEAFAEVGSHLILDRTARTYLPTGLADYFDAKVFVSQAPKSYGSAVADQTEQTFQMASRESLGQEGRVISRRPAVIVKAARATN
jgi:hypothetical protein